MSTFRISRGWFASMLPLILLPLLAPSSPPPQRGSVPVPNGSFDEGFSGWTLEPCTGGFGGPLGHFEMADAVLADLTPFGGDSQAACLRVTALASREATKSTGSAAQAQMSMRRNVRIRGRFLEFRTAGNYEVTFFANSQFRFRAQVVVEGGGKRADLEVAADGLNAELDCLPGLIGFGVLPQSIFAIDLYARGFRPGDEVSLQVLWEASVVALNECDDASFFGDFCVDELQFLEARNTPTIQPPNRMETRGVFRR